MSYVQQRRQELLGDRRRKYYRDSAIVRQMLLQARKERLERSAGLRLQKFFGLMKFCRPNPTGE
jgi:hypothetical protein